MLAAALTGAALVLTACGGGGAAPGASTSITVLNRWSDPAQRAAADQMFADFTAETGITVNNAAQPSSGSTYQPAVRSAFSSSNPPALATDISGPELFTFAQGDVLSDITDFYDKSIKPRATAGATSGTMLDGKVYGISAGLSVGNLIWYNPDYLRKYGVDPSTLGSFTAWTAAMQKIKAAGGTPIVIGAKDQWPGGHYLNDLVQRALGSEQATALYNRTVLPGQPDSPKWTDPGVVDALRSYVAMKPLFQDGFLGEAQATADDTFLDGKAGFYEMGSWFLTTMATKKPAFTPGVMLFPALDGGRGSQAEVTVANDVLMVSKDADPVATQKFLEYFTRPTTAAKLGAGLTKLMPYRTEGPGTVDPTIAAQFEKVKGFVDVAGPQGAALYNDQGIDLNIYTKYIWQGSVGLMSGDITPEQLAQQLEDATAAAQSKNR